ncbi:MAG TPA: FAD-dependent oxidoreductase [bacterium]|jgi:hypothetical protein
MPARLLRAVLGAALLLTFSGGSFAAAPPRQVAVDVLVVGGTPAGIAAAAGAARAGARVHLVEGRPKLGGPITWAWLTTFDMNLSPEGVQLTRGVFSDYYKLLGLSFDLGEAITKLTWAVYREVLVNVTENAPLLRPVMEGRRIVGAEFDDKAFDRTLIVRAKIVIDATDDADLAAAAGAGAVMGREGPRGDRWMQPATLIFRVDGVNWDAVTRAIMDRRAGDPAHWGVNGTAAWGFWDEMRGYKPSQPDAGVLGLNMALQHDGSILINTLQIFGVDGTTQASLDQGMVKAQRELPRLVGFLRETIPGYDNARLVDHAPALYVRETRHVDGFYTLTVRDILMRRQFDDRIAVASYPIDIHPYRPDWSNPYAPVRHMYTIPFRALVPQGVDGLLVASRSFSATSEAAGSARVIPTTMGMGHAAGIAAAVCAKDGCLPETMARTPALLRRLQQILLAQGAYLGPGPTP